MLNRLRRFFIPPPGSSRLRRLLSLGALLSVPIFILLAIPPAWEYSNSAEFCGKTCHTMPPEYNTYLVSPHARVLCVDCHIGRDWMAKQFVRKTGHMHLLWATITGDYTYPIRIKSMRPARETCERCHYPEKFSDDSLRVIHRYADDEDNSPYDLYLLMHTGGGSQRQGLGQGIHWHIENKIDYVVLDKEEQQIPWVRVRYTDGRTEEFMSATNPIDADNLDQYTVRKMDCTSCHNRISHLIDTPDNLVDKALRQGDLPVEIPFIRTRAVEVLSASYATVSEAHTAIAGLEDYYRTNYPDYYTDQADEVTQAIEIVQKLYSDNTFPEQKLDWNTHPDNIGHRNAPGCFRCHDGQHFNVDQEAVRLECNLCHSIPQIVRPGMIEPMLPLTTGIEPSSHLDSTWISQHHTQFDETCSNCHSTDNPGGTSDTSFCSNSGCHGVDWRYANISAPELAQQLGTEQQLPEATPIAVAPGEEVTYQTLQPIFEEKCGQCHGATPTKGLRLTDYAGVMAGSQDGPVIVAGNPDGSKIVTVLTGGHFAKLTDEELALLRQWIEDDAPEGEPAAAPEATAAPTETRVPAEEEEADEFVPTLEPPDEEVSADG